MSIINPVATDYAPQGAARLAAADSTRHTRTEAIGTLRAALDDLERGEVAAVGDLLRASAVLADLTVAIARDEGTTWDEIAREIREPLADVYGRFATVHSGRPTTPRDEADAAVDSDLLDYSLAMIGRTGGRHERDEAIRRARSDGATYEQLAEASGLKRAMLDRIINTRDY